MARIPEDDVGPLAGVWRWLLVPGWALERSRGRKRMGGIVLFAAVLVVVAAFGYRWSRLAGLPKVGEPFDLGPLYAHRVPYHRNAFTLYREAADLLNRHEPTERRLAAAGCAWPAAGDAEGLAYLKANAPALETWRRGTDRDEAQCVPAMKLSMTVRFPGVNEHRILAEMALMHASRAEAAGDLDAAWGWYRAVLRGSRHLGNPGTAIERLVGASEFALAAQRIREWADDPRLDAVRLRAALAEVQSAHERTCLDSQVIQFEYVWLRDILRETPELWRSFSEQPGGEVPEVDRQAVVHDIPALWRLRWFLQHEPERSLRQARFAFANWLAACDKLPADRPPMVGTAGRPRMFYDVPAAVGPSPRDLAARIEATGALRHLLPSYAGLQQVLDREQAQRAGLIVALAEQVYRRDRGAEPESPEALIGTVLDRLPDGYLPPTWIEPIASARR